MLLNILTNLQFKTLNAIFDVLTNKHKSMSKFIILTAINESDEQESKILVNVNNIVYSYEGNNLTCIVFTNKDTKVVKETIKQIQLLIEE